MKKLLILISFILSFVYSFGQPQVKRAGPANTVADYRLEALKNLEAYVGKALAFGGIVSNVQRRTAKNGKEWASFNLEGYDESFEFKIFGEDYLNFHRYLLPNNFVYFKLLVKDGWVNRDTGKKTDPRIQFADAKQLQDVLGIFAKRLIVLLNIKDLQPEFIHKLSHLFNENKGDNQVTFEVMEIEKIKKLIEIAAVLEENEEVVFEDENEDAETSEVPENKAVQVTEVEEVKVVTKLSMVSRRLKIKISTELLVELEKMQVNFKLN